MGEVCLCASVVMCTRLPSHLFMHSPPQLSPGLQSQVCTSSFGSFFGWGSSLQIPYTFRFTCGVRGEGTLVSSWAGAVVVGAGDGDGAAPACRGPASSARSAATLGGLARRCRRGRMV